MSTTTTAASFGALLRAWRERRRLTQSELADRADVSTRHLSFLENDRSGPSRDLVLRLSEHLDLPLRERNDMLLAAGFAPAWRERTLDELAMAPVRDAIDTVLHAHAPCPAIAVDRAWNIVAMNEPAGLFADLVADHLLGPPANVYRMALHPEGLAPLVVNFAEFAHDLLRQLRREVAVTGDPRLAELLDEVSGYPDVRRATLAASSQDQAVVVPMRLRQPGVELSLFTVISTFGTPADVTVDELALETFFPADDATARHLARMAAST